MAFYENVELSERFKKIYKNATKQLQEQVDDTVQQLLQNPKLPGLRVKTHQAFWVLLRSPHQFW